MVWDVLFDEPQHIRPHEAELLMGLMKNATAGYGLTAKQRLQCIGEGWDLNVVLLFFRHSKLARLNCEPIMSISGVEIPTLLCISDHDLLLQQGLISILQQQGVQAIASALQQYDRDTQVHMIALIKAASPPSLFMLAQELEESVVDSGSSRHIHPRVVITDAEQSVALTGFDQSTQWTTGVGYLPVE